MDLDARLAAARQSPAIARWDVTVVDPRTGAMAELYCKGCGARIREYITRGRAPRLDGVPTAAYAEMVILMADGSKHVTHCCRVCAARPLDPAALDAFFLADLAAWIAGGAPELFIRAQAERVPVGWRPPIDRTESAHLPAGQTAKEAGDAR